MTAFGFIAAEKAHYPIAVMCRMLEVSASGFHAWQRRSPSQRQLSDAWLAERIRQVLSENRWVYGAWRVHAELRMAHGIRVGRKRVERLMRTAGLSGLVPKRRGQTTVGVPGVRVADDLVNRQFRPGAPNVLWVADITYLRTWEGGLYLAAVQDAYSRRIVGWSMADHMRSDLVVDALNMAVARRAPEAGLIHHSDQALDLAKTDLDASRGTVLVRRGKGGWRREVGMDRWAWSQLEPWIAVRRQLPVGALLCVIRGATAGRRWESSSARKQLARTAVRAGVRRRFVPHQLRYARAVEMAHEGVPLVVIERQLGHAKLGITSIYFRGSTVARSSTPSTRDRRPYFQQPPALETSLVRRRGVGVRPARFPRASEGHNRRCRICPSQSQERVSGSLPTLPFNAEGGGGARPRLSLRRCRG